jgi:hypothetical protein
MKNVPFERVVSQIAKKILHQYGKNKSFFGRELLFFCYIFLLSILMREKGFHLIHSNLDSRHSLPCSKILTNDITELAKKSRELNKKRIQSSLSKSIATAKIW